MVLSKDMKIAICFGLIVGVLISICNMCFASENVEINFISDRNVSTNGVITEASGRYIGVVELEPGYVYTFTASEVSSNAKRIFFGDSYNVGDTLHNSISVPAGDTYTFTANDIGYMFFVGVSGATTTALGTITREPLQGMTNFIDNMAYSLSIGDLSSVFNLVVPILAISVLLGLGFYLLKRLLNKIKRAKGGA